MEAGLSSEGPGPAGAKHVSLLARATEPALEARLLRAGRAPPGGVHDERGGMQAFSGARLAQGFKTSEALQAPF